MGKEMSSEEFKMELAKVEERHSRVVPLKTLVRKIKEEVKNHKKVEGSVFYKVGSLSVEGVEVIRSYNFLGDVAKEISKFYDDDLKAENKAFPDALSSLSNLVNPCIVNVLYKNRVLIEAPKNDFH